MISPQSHTHKLKVIELVILLVAVSVLVQSGHTAPLGLPSNNSVAIAADFNLKQRIAFCIGQMECLKTLLSGASDQYGLGVLHRGNYSSDITIQCYSMYKISIRTLKYSVIY